MSRIEWCCIAVLALIIAASVVGLVEEWCISRKELHSLHYQGKIKG